MVKSPIVSYFLKVYAETLAQYMVNNELPLYDVKLAGEVFKENFQAMYNEVCKDAKQADSAFLGSNSVTSTVISVATKEYCCRLCKIVYERMVVTIEK